MPGWDYDGTTYHELGKGWDYDGTTYHELGKGWDYDGTTYHEIYTSEQYLYNMGAVDGYDMTGYWNAGSVTNRRNTDGSWYFECYLANESVDSGIGNCHVNKPINLNSFSKIYCEVGAIQLVNNFSPQFFVGTADCSPRSGTKYAQTGVTNGNSTIILDVSNLTNSSAYVGIYGWVTYGTNARGYVNVKRIWGE